MTRGFIIAAFSAGTLFAGTMSAAGQTWIEPTAWIEPTERQCLAALEDGVVMPSISKGTSDGVYIFHKGSVFRILVDLNFISCSASKFGK